VFSRFLLWSLMIPPFFFLFLLFFKKSFEALSLSVPLPDL